MENASRAFLDAVRKSMRQIGAAIGAATINPSLLTSAERIKYGGYRVGNVRAVRWARYESLRPIEPLGIGKKFRGLQRRTDTLAVEAASTTRVKSRLPIPVCRT